MVKITIMEDSKDSNEVSTEVVDESKESNVVSTHNHNKLILTLMIKNESRIIERCLMHAIEHVDAVCILDTGSTDDTVEV